MEHWHLAGGYFFAGVHSGIRSDTKRLDLALVISDRPANAAGVFTQNKVVAAPVHSCRERLPSNAVRGIVICSGNANACTGEQGRKDAERMAQLTAEMLSCEPKQILVCSTGVIGVPLPMQAVEGGIRSASNELAANTESLSRAAHAILTTDTRIKVSTRTIESNGNQYQITGFAKGAAMIGPNMATMLAFVLSDAAVEANHLADLCKKTASKTFNCISVEGHTSTNDTLLILANGDGKPLAGTAVAEFDDAVLSVCTDLAREIVSDAEGASHLIRIDVEGLLSDEEAYRIAKTVAESALVKTAVFGADPNWGRIVSAAGYAGVDFKEENCSLWLADTLLYKNGSPMPIDEAALSGHMKENRELTMRLQFTLGTGRCTFWTSDLTYEYVRLNAEYTT